MSNLAQRIRDIRYKKGLGPDALAARAEISRTALYQIECGKTEVPRAGTLRRIAEALDVPIDQLLGYWPKMESQTGTEIPDSMNIIDNSHSGQSEHDWAMHDEFEAGSFTEPKRLIELGHTRDDVLQKLEDLLDSRFGDSISRIIHETHKVMLASRRDSHNASRGVGASPVRIGR